MKETIQSVIGFTWPMIFISVVIVVSLRLTYLYKNKKPLIIYKELLMLLFMVYALCLFQVVTFQDVSGIGSNNFIPFKEIFRYEFGTRLFLKNILGNMLMFVPYGFFVSYCLKLKKPRSCFFLILVASISIETTQLVIGRVFDVDDILLNVLGGMIGYLLYYLLQQIEDKLPKFVKSEWFLNILTILLLVGFVFLI